jgi:hypothetical protein
MLSRSSIIRRAFCLSALVLAAACESGTEPAREGVFDGTWAGQRFAGDAEAVVVGDSLYLVGGSPAGAMDQVFVAIGIGGVEGPGEYPLGPGAAELRYLVGGDGIWAGYETTQPDAGMVVVTSTTGGLFTGHVRFTADAQPGGTPAGARAEFDADFRAPVARHTLGLPIGAR